MDLLYNRTLSNLIPLSILQAPAMLQFEHLLHNFLQVNP